MSKDAEQYVWCKKRQTVQHCSKVFDMKVIVIRIEKGILRLGYWKGWMLVE